jgi:hypothetical protein
MDHALFEKHKSQIFEPVFSFDSIQSCFRIYFENIYGRASIFAINESAAIDFLGQE